MSTKYTGGFITKSPVAPTSTAASGIWTLDQQQQYQKAGTWPAPIINYIEDTFSTYIYTGNGSTQTITNGIDLSGKGGLVWIKARSNAFGHNFYDTARGRQYKLASNSTAAQTGPSGSSNDITSFNSNGFSLGVEQFSNTNLAPNTYASWTFREQEKFFDVVTYTGNGVQGRQISHALVSTPGCIIVKCTSTTSNWTVYHRSLTTNYILQLNSTTNAINVGSPNAYVSAPTDTTFTVGNDSDVNSNGATYVAYLFAHDAGGFGLTGTDNVISCGFYTGNGATDGPTVTVGFEPQWVMIKRATGGTGNWRIIDTIRGFSVAGYTMSLFPNTTGAENTAVTSLVRPTATGFKLSAIDGDTNAGSSDYIYIAIRRGPMKVPTSGTSVYNAITWSGNDVTGRNLAHGLLSPPDLSITNWRNGLQENLLWDKLRGFSTTSSSNSVYLRTQTTGGDGSLADYYYIPNMVNVAFGSVASSTTQSNGVSSTMVGWNFRRAPTFFDEVCYTGTGSNTTQAHNLAAVPELIIVKRRDAGSAWDSYSSALANTEYIVLNTTAAKATGATRWNSTTPTSSVFSVGTSTTTNANGGTYVAYLFATCAGVSKVGSYTGTGALQTVNCGFTSGARFVLIKRTDNTGDWYVYDSARGITAGNDPYLFLNNIDSEVTGTNYVDTDTTGFKVTAAALSTVNVSGGTYIFLAIA